MRVFAIISIVAFAALAPAAHAQRPGGDSSQCADRSADVEVRIESCRAWLRESPKQPDAHRNLALLLMHRAIECAEKGAERDHRSESEHLMRCQGPNAVAAIDEALLHLPNDRDLRIGRGALLMALNRPRQAYEEFEQVTRLNPYDPASHRMLALALGHIGRQPEEIEAWRTAVRLGPDSAEYHAQLGAALTRSGEHAGALESFARAEQLGWDDHLILHFHRAEALFGLGRHEEALAAYEESIARAPTHARSWGGRARAQARLARHADAMGSWERARAIYAAQYTREFFETAPDQRREYQNSLNQSGRLPAATWSGHYVIGGLHLTPPPADRWTLSMYSQEDMLILERLGAEIGGALQKYSHAFIQRIRFEPEEWPGADSAAALMMEGSRELITDDDDPREKPYVIQEQRRWRDAAAGVRRQWASMRLAQAGTALTRSPIERAGSVAVLVLPDAEQTRTVYRVVVMQFFDARTERPDPALLASLVKALRRAK